MNNTDYRNDCGKEQCIKGNQVSCIALGNSVFDIIKHIKYSSGLSRITIAA